MGSYEENGAVSRRLGWRGGRVRDFLPRGIANERPCGQAPTSSLPSPWNIPAGSRGNCRETRSRVRRRGADRRRPLGPVRPHQGATRVAGSPRSNGLRRRTAQRRRASRALVIPGGWRAALPGRVTRPERCAAEPRRIALTAQRHRHGIARPAPRRPERPPSNAKRGVRALLARRVGGDPCRFFCSRESRLQCVGVESLGY